MEQNEQPAKDSQTLEVDLGTNRKTPSTERQTDDKFNSPADPKKPGKNSAVKLAKALKEQAELAVTIAKLEKDVDSARSLDVKKLLRVLGEACFKMLADSNFPQFGTYFDKVVKSYLGSRDLDWYSANCKSLLSHGLPAKSSKPPKSANADTPSKDNGKQAGVEATPQT